MRVPPSVSRVPVLVSPGAMPLIIAIDDTSSGAGWAFTNNGAPADERMRFQFVDLDAGIPENTTPEYASTQALGRAEQFKSYAGSSNREVSLTFHLHAQGLAPATNAREAIDAEVMTPALWLQRLGQPTLDEDQGIWYPPPTVVLIIGRLLNMRCVVTSAVLQWLGPWEADTLLPHRAVVAVTFTSVAGRIANSESGWAAAYRNQMPSSTQSANVLANPSTT